jgi:thiamine biosynthesis lipoprotein
VAGVVELADGALATSGNYRHWVDVAGQSFSHSMDPRTGRPLQNGIAAVTVRAQSCMLADAWATALLVLGEQAGRALAGTVGVEALYIAEA